MFLDVIYIIKCQLQMQTHTHTLQEIVDLFSSWKFSCSPRKLSILSLSESANSKLRINSIKTMVISVTLHYKIIFGPFEGNIQNFTLCMICFAQDKCKIAFSDVIFLRNYLL